MRIDDLEWTDEDIEHLLQAHQVTPDEVIDCLLGIEGEEPKTLAYAEGDHYVLFGEASNGRLTGDGWPRDASRRVSCLQRARHGPRRKAQVSTALPRPLEGDLFMPATTTRKSDARLRKELESSKAHLIDKAQPIRTGVVSNVVTFRLSKPLIDRLDLAALQQNRTRSNLIQFILWKYLQNNKLLNLRPK